MLVNITLYYAHSCVREGSRRVRTGRAGAFVFIVTLVVHVPGVFNVPPQIPSESAWLWTVFQRSHLVKNLCLFGVCVHLTTQAPGRFSIDAWRGRR